jgi:hypothetical protein
MFTYTEAIPLVKELVINFPRNMLTQVRQSRLCVAKVWCEAKGASYVNIIVWLCLCVGEQELAALAVNLTWNGRNAELMCQKGGLKRLIERVVDKKDPLLMKVRSRPRLILP